MVDITRQLRERGMRVINLVDARVVTESTSRPIKPNRFSLSSSDFFQFPRRPRWKKFFHRTKQDSRQWLVCACGQRNSLSRPVIFPASNFPTFQLLNAIVRHCHRRACSRSSTVERQRRKTVGSICDSEAMFRASSCVAFQVLWSFKAPRSKEKLRTIDDEERGVSLGDRERGID